MENGRVSEEKPKAKDNNTKLLKHSWAEIRTKTRAFLTLAEETEERRRKLKQWLRFHREHKQYVHFLCLSVPFQ